MNSQILELPALVGEVGTFQHFLEELLRRHGYTDDLVHDLSLVSEELLVNIISHGYRQSPNGTIQVQVDLLPEQRVRLVFRDCAHAFNPLEAQERDPDDERLGGWGIPMLKELTDRLEYRREAGQNVLLLERSERDS